MIQPMWRRQIRNIRHTRRCGSCMGMLEGALEKTWTGSFWDAHTCRKKKKKKKYKKYKKKQTHAHTLPHTLSSPSSVLLKAHTYRMHKIIKYSPSCIAKKKKHTPPHRLAQRSITQLLPPWHARAHTHTHTHTHTLRVNKIIKHPEHHMNSCSSVFIFTTRTSRRAGTHY